MEVKMAIIYIGMAHCLFATLLVFSKRPLRIADKILGVWLLMSSFLFIFNFLIVYYNIQNYIWQIPYLLTITFPEFLVLYTIFITSGDSKFRKKYILFFIPSLVAFIAIFFSYIANPGEFFSLDVRELGLPSKMLTYLLYLTLTGYSLVALLLIYFYKKRISHSYSFDSSKINLSWLIVVIVGYYLTNGLLVVLSTYYFKAFNFDGFTDIGNAIQLLFIYLLSYFGFRQQYLITDRKPVVLSKFLFKDSSPDKYQKSGLKEISKVEEYLKKLVDDMNKLEPWKDNELSVAKLSEITGIPRHYITQILNDNLQKNFYTFVNEYRTEHAKKLIVSPDYSHWSIVAIAYESGFNSKAAFNNFFKKYTGITPSEFKKNHIVVPKKHD
ncbi:AraC family transcriptional regulator [uncultured Draconibacterium sp.]|uniref:helix-turn-helix domain-containing protein n=1 Tax=uncultured Draconibacterium sp. TaxID=1573823 RepID=UPI0025E45628|nr:helix-turn-helix domain-containing protein [uncultured Draconibacterium sp.]